MRHKRYGRRLLPVLWLTILLSLPAALPAKAQDGIERADLIISSVEQFHEFAADVNSGNTYEGKLVRLVKDLVFDGETDGEFVNISNFEGTFDGGEHTVSGICCVSEKDPKTGAYVRDAGLFDCISEGGIVKNLTVRASKVTGGCAGGIVARNYGTIKNCHVRNTEIFGNKSGGGIAGENYGKIVNCSSNAHVVADDKESACAGGIAGQNVGYRGDLWVGGYYYDVKKGNIGNCLNEGMVEGNPSGGIVGSFGSFIEYTGGILQSCYNVGKVSGSTAGGIIGREKLGICLNNFYAEESVDSGTGANENNKCLPADDMKGEAFAERMNSNRGWYTDWMEWECRGDSEYPQLKGLTDLSDFQITLEGDSFAATGEEIRPEVIVRDSRGNLVGQSFYEVFYRDNVEEGTGRVLVSGQDIYKGYAAREFCIWREQAEIECETYYKKTYGNPAFSLEAEMTEGDGVLEYRSSDVQVAVVSRTGVVSIQGTGRAVITVSVNDTSVYKGKAVNIVVDVCPKKQKVKARAVKNRRMKVRWKRDRQADGYQVRYGTGKKLAGNAKSKMILRSGKSFILLKKLKKKKIYYVRVRAFRNIWENGKTIRLYGPWSGIKKVKTAGR